MTTIQRTTSSLATLLLLAAVGACSGGAGGGGGPPTGSQTGSVSGRVTAAGAGVQGVSVAVQGAGSGTTDASGNFRIDNVSAGSRTVVVTPPEGWITGSVTESTSRPATVTAGQTASVSWTLKRGVVVTASGTSFTPAAVTIGAGHTVRWVNGSGSHTVTPDNAAQTGAWQSASLGAGAFEHTFTVADVFPYHCIPHQAMGMTGTVTVQP